MELPKGNGKSYLLSAVNLYLAFADGEHAAEVYCVAGDREQARIVFNTCKDMVEGSPKLSAVLECYKNSIINKANLSSIKVISAEAYSKHGYRPYGICFDEMHVQPNRELYDTLTRGMIKREGSMCWMITTAGIKNTFAETIHDYANKIQTGLIEDPSWLPVIYTVPLEVDAFDEKYWKEANPGLGTILNLDNFRILAREAQNNPTALNGFRRLHLNHWTGSTEAWIPPHVFEKCNLGVVPEEDLINIPCWAGLDLASTRDLCSFSLIWELPNKNKKKEKDPDFIYLWRCWFWCPEDTVLERTLKENVNYEQWVNEGYIFTTPGNAVDHTYIEKFIIEMHEKYGFSLGFDPWNADQLAARLYTNNDIKVRKIPQNISKLSGPAKWLESRVIQQEINYEGNPVLPWQMDNVEISRDSNDNIKPHKGKSKGKIDGIYSCITAIAEMMECKKEEEKEIDFKNVVSWIGK